MELSELIGVPEQIVTGRAGVAERTRSSAPGFKAVRP